jgi:hypothetical protein
MYLFPKTQTRRVPQSLTTNSGQKLRIEATGTFKEDIEQDAYVQLQVKYGLVRLINTKADLCEQVKNVDMECPIKKGKTTITKEVDMPNEIPPVSPACNKLFF